MITLKDYRKIVGDDIIDEILKEARPLRGKYVVHVNSTYYGGGVAEILDSLVYLMNEVGINAGWRQLKGSDDFFRTTKIFHNGCQGACMKLTPRIKKLYEETNYRNSRFMHLERTDAIIVHDPQVLPLIKFYKKNQPWIWRCHIDITRPNRELWRYIKGFVKNYDAMIISDQAYKKKDIKIPQYVIMPSIDPLHEKNKKLRRREAQKILAPLGINTEKPIICQVSRYDYWKDPLGVLEAFKKARKKVDCQLVMIGNYATDDPEGLEMYKRVNGKAKNIKDAKILVNVENNNLVVNALQTLSAVVLQKSIREGFGLTVSEALWKGTPVIGGRAGGIPNQIVEGKNGYLVDNVSQCAHRIVDLMKNEKQRQEMGKFGHDFVLKNFLITRHLLDYIKLLKMLMIKYLN